jgi:ferredoxin
VRYRRREAVATASPRPPAAAAATTATRRARLRIDLDLCQGHGVCVAEAPELFALDEKQSRARLRRADVSEDQRERAEAAVRYCPTRALSIEED